MQTDWPRRLGEHQDDVSDNHCNNAYLALDNIRTCDNKNKFDNFSNSLSVFIKLKQTTGPQHLRKKVARALRNYRNSSLVDS